MNWQWKDILKLIVEQVKSRQDETEKQQSKHLELSELHLYLQYINTLSIALKFRQTLKANAHYPKISHK
ncbi:hypothetical protein I79_002687 [Cricetulus griseus]|uniref:Uncharacterized protein n=1 Tax=Cricetulus griseus TaxID=10029 RepID=G3GY32_CRIGR|nr:hypothetical protein I79_002687 [Cricetulus griseus]